MYTVVKHFTFQRTKVEFGENEEQILKRTEFTLTNFKKEILKIK